MNNTFNHIVTVDGKRVSLRKLHAAGKLDYALRRVPAVGRDACLIRSAIDHTLLGW